MQLSQIFSALISLVLCIIYFRCPSCLAKGNPLIIDRGYLGEVVALNFSADGKFLTTGGWDKSLIVWDTLTGDQRLVIHSLRRITAVDFSSDSKILAAGTEDSTVELFDMETSQAVRTLGRPDRDPPVTSGVRRLPIVSHSVDGLAFSADGRTLACVIGGHELQMWNYTDGSRLNSPEEAPSWYSCDHDTPITFSPDGKVLAYSENSEARDVPKMKNTFISIGVQLGLVPASARNLSAKPGVVLLDVVSRKQLRFLETEKNPTAIAFTPDGSEVITNNSIWNAADGKLKKKVSGCPRRIAVGADGKIVGACYNEKPATEKQHGALSLCQLPAGGKSLLLMARSAGVRQGEFSKDGKMFAASCSDDTIKLWDVATGRLLHTLRGRISIPSIACSGDGARLAVARGNRIHLFDLKNAGSVLRTLVGHTSSVKTVAFSTDGTLLASGGETVTSVAFDCVFCCTLHDYPKVWNAASGKLCSNKQGRPVSGLTFISNGKLLVNSLGNIFDSSTGKLLRSLNTKDYSEKVLDPTATYQSMNVASCIAVNLKGDVAALGISDQTVRLFELAGGHQVRKLVGHTGPVLAVAISADGALVASAGEDKLVKLWDSHTGKIQFSMSGHDASVQTLSFSSGGKTLASAGADGTIKFWDTRTGQELATLTILGDKSWVVMDSQAHLTI